jgi:hypothetical protein
MVLKMQIMQVEGGKCNQLIVLRCDSANTDAPAPFPRKQHKAELRAQRVPPAAYSI